MAIRICPSILNADHSDLPQEIARVATADLLHLDVMDNIFVPNITFSLDECREIISTSQIPVDSHLMIAHPDSDAVLYAEAGSASVTFHLEASGDPLTTIQNLKSLGVRVGVAIKPKTTFAEVAPFIEYLDMLLIMTVEPGFGGQSFMVDQMDKVMEARKNLNLLGSAAPWLQVDGGISLETIAIAAKAGADTFVAGSAIYKSQNPAEMIAALRQAASSVN